MCYDYLWLLSTHDAMQIMLSPAMCAHVEKVLWIIKKQIVVFIELKKENIPTFSLFYICS